MEVKENVENLVELWEWLARYAGNDLDLVLFLRVPLIRIGWIVRWTVKVLD